MGPVMIFIILVEETVTRFGIRVELVSLPVLGKLRAEFPHILGRWILVLFSKMTLKRTVDIRRSLKRRWRRGPNIPIIPCIAKIRVEVASFSLKALSSTISPPP